HGCLPALEAAITSHHVTQAHIFKKGALENPAFVAHAKANDPGSVKELAPMLVVQGTADTTVPPALTDGYVKSRACKLGDRIEYLHVNGASHGTVVFASIPTIVQWMTARLRGVPATSTCGRPGDVVEISP
ncbi:MAG: alpha/beta hydrolase family protein, partial [Acidimicrobiales bacterium]